MKHLLTALALAVIVIHLPSGSVLRCRIHKSLGPAPNKTICRLKGDARDVLALCPALQEPLSSAFSH